MKNLLIALLIRGKTLINNLKIKITKIVAYIIESVKQNIKIIINNLNTLFIIILIILIIIIIIIIILIRFYPVFLMIFWIIKEITYTAISNITVNIIELYQFILKLLICIKNNSIDQIIYSTIGACFSNVYADEPHEWQYFNIHNLNYVLPTDLLD